MPAAIFAIILLVAGATKIKSAHLANSICPIAASADFIDDIALEQAKQKNQFDYIEQLICNALASLNIHIKANAISFSKQP